jgi:DNA ligase (NAD+)
MQDATLERINQEALQTGGKVYASTRNLTAGTLKLKNLTEVANREIQFMIWDVLDETNVLSADHYDRVNLVAKAMGLTYFGVKISRKLVGKELEEQIARRMEVVEQYGIQCDGVVIKCANNAARRKMGNGTKFANYQICFKPQQSSGVTYLRNVIWQIGRQGKLTPVGIVEPIVLAGATINRVTLNNITWIRAMGLKMNSKVRVLRSGDVIPVITEVLDDDEA